MGPLFFLLLVCAFLLVGSAIRMSTCKDIALCAPYTSKRMKTRPGEAGGERNRQFGQGEAWSGYSLPSTRRESSGPGILYLDDGAELS